MNVSDPTLVIVRGINAKWFEQNFTEMWIGFGDAAVAIPKQDANYIGLYLEAPVSAITHIGIVDSIERYEGGADFYLKAIIKLDKPIKPDHQIRKHEYWHLEDFGLSHLSIYTGLRVTSKYLSYEAINTFLFLNETSFNSFYIDEEIYYQRLKVVIELIDPRMTETIERVRIQMQLLGEFGQEHSERDWGDSSFNTETGRTSKDHDVDNDPPNIYFLTVKAGKVSKWKFNLTDRDFFPSIPHGHAIVDYRLKLDSYLGHIYKEDNYYGREERQYIVDLWNDESFRKNAIETIKFYMREYPKFQWRVQDPLRIPKRRK